jgi:MYXO-CTERM domain-containing protein
MTPAIASSLVLLSILDCNTLPKGDMTSPYYWGDVFLAKYADELVVGELEPGPEPLAEPRTVLLITGVTIPAAWFDPIVARLERDGFRPVVWEPPALLSYSLFEASEDLADVVERVRAESGQDRIDILAECTGGVIARHYIQSMGGNAYVSRLVTFVSPQHGVAKAPLAAALAGWPALHDLSPGSEFLTAVNSAPLPDDVAVTSIYTCTDEYIQPYTTSIIPGATNIGLCDEFVGHFQTFYDPDIYLIMHAALIEPVAGDDADDEADADDGKPDDGGDDEAGDPATSGGCAVGGGNPSALAPLLALLLLGTRRRRQA